jgi:MarR family transcriptional regulator, temperature-dependent positive regulator of motility
MSFTFENSLFHQLHRAGQAAANVFEHEQGGDDLTLRQLIVLAAIAEREGASQNGIVEITGIDRSTLADLVRRLTKRGLLKRRRAKTDARAYAIHLTPPGRTALDANAEVLKRAEGKLLTQLTTPQQVELVRSLKILAQAAATDSRQPKTG